jgi:hypothetical protein
MNPERLRSLLSAYVDGALSPAEKIELEHALRSSSAARTQFWEETRLHDQLRAVVGESTLPHPTAQMTAPARLEAREPSFLRALFRRPVPALAAGIVLSALCTSAVWAYAGQFLGAKTKPLTLLLAGFEELPPVPPLGVPNRPNTWSGDYTALVGPENGVRPRSGKTMLRFLRADNALGDAGPVHYVAEAIHVVDLRSMKEELRSGNAQIEIGAHFAAIAGDEDRKVRFLLKAATFTGNPEDAPTLWEDASSASLSMVQQQVDPAPVTGSWQPLRVTISVPPLAQFLVFECGAVHVRPSLREGTAAFPGHYLDDVTVHLRQSDPSATRGALPLSR